MAVLGKLKLRGGPGVASLLEKFPQPITRNRPCTAKPRSDRPLVKIIVLPITACLFLATLAAAETHPPMRPLPQPIKGDLAPGPKRFVDAAKGDDANDGSQANPWKTLSHSFRQLKPGDTLYLRGGIYYEKAALTRSGTPEAPITISSHPGELAVIDGGLREFLEDPAGSW